MNTHRIRQYQFTLRGDGQIVVTVNSNVIDVFPSTAQPLWADSAAWYAEWGV